MSPDYYVFALYVFILICAVIIMCKYLFADVRRRNKILDEKEEKLLRTYRTLEDAMDEFYDLADETKAELEQKLKKLNEPANYPSAGPKEPAHYTQEAQQVASELETNEMQVSIKPDRDRLAFEQLFNEITVKTGVPLSAAHEKVLKLAEQGKSYAEIAKDLQITQNEIELIIGINKTQRIKIP